VALLGTTVPAAADPPKANRGVSDRTAAQIAALQQIKTSTSGAEAKVDAALVVERRLRADRQAQSALPAVTTGVKVLEQDTVLVDVRAHKVTDALLAAITRAKGTVRSVSTQGATVRAQVPLSALTTLAAQGDVKRVETASDAQTQRMPAQDAEARRAPSKEDTDRDVEARTQRAREAAALAVRTAESDRAHAADTARQQFRVTGTGVKLCALSDGVDSLSVSQASGELPAVDVLAGQEGDGDEGTAMLEILHDLAPNAELGFATAFNGDASFADNIRALRFDLGCDVIVDDILYYNESPFQDGPIARSVDAVAADGAVYFSSAGNQGNVVDGTAAHWEGQWSDSGAALGKFAGTAHDFDPDPVRVQAVNPLTASASAAPVTLFWADPLGRSDNDYDLYATDSAGNVVAFSQGVQNGTQDPYERLNTTAGGQRISIVKFRGESRYLDLSTYRGRFTDTADGLKKFVTPGVTRGHSAANGAISVAAAPAAVAFSRALEPGDPANPVGPFPGTFSAATKLERFTSDGPRRTFFAPDGSPREEVRQKPDITAADGVQTSVPGFNPFFGTSAAAPNAAAIAGLVLSGNPGLSPAEVREALTATAVDIVAPGVDNRSGAGVVLADAVLAHTGASPQPLPKAGAPTLRNDSDGSAYLKPGTTSTLTVPVTNTGDGASTSTSLVLSTPAPGVTIAPRAKSYGTVDVGQTAVNTFKVTVPATAALGLSVPIDARLTFAGSLSPTSTRFPLVVGQPSTEVTSFAYAGEPVPIPDNNSLGATVTIPVSGVGQASSLALSIDGTQCGTTTGSTTVGLAHTYVGDLVGRLTSPSGATVVVFQRNGGSGKNMCQTVFTDSAATSFSSVTGANAPFTGSFRPAGTPLGTLLSEPVDGDWTFSVVDVASGDAGFVRSVSLRTTGYVA
jgi:subtilisin-like proprotein convertase family protein